MNGGYSYYASQSLPPPIAPTEFAPLAQVESDAPANYYGKEGSRLSLRQSGYASSDGFSHLPFLSFHDRKLATNCSPTTLQDGKNYCAGAYRYFGFEPSSGVFAKADCTEPVVGVEKLNPSCAPNGSVTNAQFFAGRPYSPSGCQTVRLYKVGTPTSASPWDSPGRSPWNRTAGPPWSGRIWIFRPS